MPYSPHHDIGLDLFLQATKILGAPQVRAEAVFEAIWASGMRPRRFFHTPEHYAMVGGETEALKRAMQGGDPFVSSMQALRYKAGFDHDVVYTQIDHKADDCEGNIHPLIRRYITQLCQLTTQDNGDITVRFDDSLLDQKRMELIQATNFLFGFDPEAKTLHLQWFINQNEYLSALFAIASGLEMKIAAKYLLAEAAMIEATVPFGAPSRLRVLRSRLEQANRRLESPLLPQEISEAIAQAEAISNTDVGDFQKHFHDCITGTFLVLLENSMGHVDIDNADQIDPQPMGKAMEGMRSFLGALVESSRQAAPARAIFHMADGTRHPAEETAIATIGRVCNYLQEASENLSLLSEHYQFHHETEATRWGQIRQMLFSGGTSAPQSAMRFFCLIGCQALAEIITTLRLTDDERQFIDQVLQLRMQVSLPLTVPEIAINQMDSAAKVIKLERQKATHPSAINQN